MCGRYTVSKSEAKFRKAFGLQKSPELFQPRFNVAPTQLAPVVTNEAPDEIAFYRWGLVPSWAKDVSIGNKLINARSETVHEKPSFRSALKKRRCLVLADGYYEWQKTNDGKVPYWIHRKDEDVIAFAGLWEYWRPTEADEPLHTFTILTTEAQESLKKLHDRMPVILTPETAKVWIDITVPSTEVVTLFNTFPKNLMTYHAVSKAVNSPRNESPDLIIPSPK